jgi:hypothetical protein
MQTQLFFFEAFVAPGRLESMLSNSIESLLDHPDPGFVCWLAVVERNP